MNTKLFLLLGTSLSFLPQLTFAQCVATQDCTTLGYTETSCAGGKGIKCPFGNKWACIPTKDSVCKEEGFTLACTGTGQIGSGDSCNGLYKKCSCNSTYKYTCSGTGYSGGSGTACGGKYTSCKCASGYEWKNGDCHPKITDGAHGELYYCNGKVVGVKTAGMNFYIAMKDLGRTYWVEAYRQCINYSFCDNVKGNMPTIDEGLFMIFNKSTLNNLLLANGGDTLMEDNYWSSSGDYFNDSFRSVITPDGSEWSDSVGSHYYYRPVLTSW